MHCYVCDANDKTTPAVAVCHNCGVALCREHLDQDLLLPRAHGLVRRGCTHAPVHLAQSARTSSPTTTTSRGVTTSA